MEIRGKELVTAGVAVVAGLVALAPVRADGEDRVRGFVTYGVGDVSGRVTDEDGTPLPNAAVHLVSGSAGEVVVTADKAGKFKATVKDGGSSWVFVRGNAKIDAQAFISSEGDGEIVEIHEAIPPSVMPRPLSNPHAILEYSDQAIGHNTWTRGWLMLDVDAAGSVRRVKLLKSPGFDLDAIAVRKAFELKFRPALDRAHKPTSALAIWVFEWPAYYWLLEILGRGDNTMTRMPPEARAVPCRGTGPTHSTYRDCSRPELGKGMAQPWIDRPKKTQ